MCDANTDSDGYGDTFCHCDSYSDADCNTKSYSNSKTSPKSAPSPNAGALNDIVIGNP